MAGQPTSSQPLDGPVKWALAVGMFVAIAALVAVASGVLSQGTDPGAGGPATGSASTTEEPDPTEDPTGTATTLPPGLAGRWQASGGGARLTFGSDGRFVLTTADGRTSPGEVLSTGAGLVLAFDGLPTRLRVEVVGDDVLVVGGPSGATRFDRVT